VAFPRDNIHTVWVDFDAFLVPQWLRFNFSYSYSSTDGQIDYASPLGTAANDLNAFEPASFTNADDVKFHSVNPELEWRLGERLSLMTTYLYEKNTIDDYNYQGFRYFATTLAGGTNSGLLMGSFLFPRYSVNVFSVRLKLGL
jgi:hypothetical protein